VENTSHINKGKGAALVGAGHRPSPKKREKYNWDLGGLQAWPEPGS